MAKRFALIIEDQQDIADIYSQALKLAGFDTHIIYDGKDALTQLPGIEPELILLDMNLPHVSGHYLFKEIRNIPHLVDIPVIICTANSVLANAMKSEIGATDFILIKPVSIHQLNDLVKQIFRN
jgi:DNA-binding response OmpR family regulator